MSWGGTATGARPVHRTCIRLVLDVGLGFGALPNEHERICGPFAITGELSTTTPGQDWSGTATQFATTFNWGFTLQYSLPYFNSHSAEIDNDVPQASHPDRRVRFLNANRQCGTGDLGRRREPSNPASSTMSDKWQIAR